MNALALGLGLLSLLSGSRRNAPPIVLVSDSSIVFSPYNWFRSGSTYAQTPNPGAYLKVGFTGTGIGVVIDVSPLTAANVPASRYPVVRMSVDGKPAKTLQLSPQTTTLSAASGLTDGNHTLFFEYVAGYVFLDFWSPVNVVRLTGFTLDAGATLVRPFGPIEPRRLNALFLGDSITNGDDDVATFERGITNEVDTQDATIGYPSLVSSGLGVEFGVVAYGGASWDGIAADGHTPGLMTTFSMIDKVHSRLVNRKFTPIPDEIFVNMGENSGPRGDDVQRLLTSLRSASSPKTNISLIVPFSGRSRSSLASGFADYRISAASDRHTYLIDLGNNLYLTDAGPTMLSVDGQHPLGLLHARLAAQLIEQRMEQGIQPSKR